MIKNYLMKIFQYSSKKQAKPPAELENINSIILDIDVNPLNSKIKFDIKNMSILAAKDMAYFLYELNNGFYIDYILNTMVSNAKKDPALRTYMHEVINTWSGLVNNNFDKPIINPSQFFKVTQHER